LAATNSRSYYEAVEPGYLRLVIGASTLGTIIEWYDFYIFGSLATILSREFFPPGDPVAAFLNTVAIFTIGFLIRPLGAFVFGRIGDLIGRKYTFLVTLTGMGLSTALIGLLPTYAQVGLLAAFILFLLRLVQGLTLGGEYGGAITYVAEHVPDQRRGFYTGILQTSPSIGLMISLVVVVGTRLLLGEQTFNAWGWRIPFLLSFLLVAISVYIRLKLQETPVFARLQAARRTSRSPWREAFLSQNIKYVLTAAVVVIGQGVVWYSGQFWALYFLQTIKKVDLVMSSTIVGTAILLASPMFIILGALSDRIGRKPIILGGMALAAITYYPLYSALGVVAEPSGLAIGNPNFWLSVVIVWVMVVYVAMVYGPIASFLAEYFPARIRYTSVSVPYHIGNGWGGGLVPYVTSAMYAATGSLLAALAYPIIIPAIMFLLSLFLVPETNRTRIWEEAALAPEAGGGGD